MDIDIREILKVRNWKREASLEASFKGGQGSPSGFGGGGGGGGGVVVVVAAAADLPRQLRD
jgi:hypothetical protein